MVEIRDEVERRAIGTLVPYAKNSRTHSSDQIEQLAASMREWGWTTPILVDETGGIIAGHGRVLAAQRLGMQEVPVIVAKGWTEAQRRAYVIADNKLALNAGWDEDILASELGELRGLGFNLDLTGFDFGELNALMTAAPPAGKTDDDAIPDAPSKPTTRVGDIWLMDWHRLMCGDSTRSADIRKLMGTTLADLWLTDPPYNVDYVGGTKSALTIPNDKMGDAAFRQFLADAFTAAMGAMKAGAAFYIWHSDSEGFNFRAACKDADLRPRQCLVWKKNSMVLGRQDYQYKHELCLYGWKDGAAHKWYGGRKQTSIRELGDGSPFVQRPDGRYEVSIGTRCLIVSGDATVEELVPSMLEFDRPTRSKEHPTMKPVALFEHQILNNTKAKGVVLDSFGGSGTTAIACEKHGRHARLMELEPKYCDVIVQRWQDFTGGSAVLEATGQSWDDVVAERRESIE